MSSSWLFCDIEETLGITQNGDGSQKGDHRGRQKRGQVAGVTNTRGA